MKKQASASWKGDLKQGKGTISTESGALSKAPFGFNTRFENETGTNPEELIGAAHAGCFAMALANELGAVGLTAERIDAKAVVHLEEKGAGFAITRSDITVSVSISDAADGDFHKAVEAAKSGCPVSNVLKTNVNVNVIVERV